MRPLHVFEHIPETLTGEDIQEILTAPGVRIERIVSKGHTSLPGFWYDQAENEWVMVLQGAARLRFAADNKVVSLNAGDAITLPAHVRHRVEWTDPDRETIWLAVFYGGEKSGCDG